MCAQFDYAGIEKNLAAAPPAPCSEKVRFQMNGYGRLSAAITWE
jgi:hypothetical protein